MDLFNDQYSLQKIIIPLPCPSLWRPRGEGYPRYEDGVREICKKKPLHVYGTASKYLISN
jgi:hypothetical protein